MIKSFLNWAMVPFIFFAILYTWNQSSGPKVHSQNTFHSQTTLNYSGKPVVLVFWATWCEACRAETNSLLQLQKEYASKIDFYFVNTTSADDLVSAEQYVKDFDIPHAIFDQTGEWTQKYGVDLLPHIVLLNKKGEAQGVVHTLDSHQLDLLFV